jgi:hypothetical protein
VSCCLAFDGRNDARFSVRSGGYDWRDCPWKQGNWGEHGRIYEGWEKGCLGGI